MVSDGTVPAAEASASAKYQMISLTNNPSMAAPWSGDGPGEGWKWGDFYVTVQTGPETFFDFSAKMAGTKERWEGLSYHFSATVFRDPQKNEFGPSSRPVLVIAVEKSDFGTMVGVFDGDVRSNLGEYVGTLDLESARATFFDFIGKRFALVGEPQRLGTIEAVREKVVTRKVGEIVGEGNSGSHAAGMAGKIRALLPKGKTVPIVAALVAFVAWGFYAKPSFLAFVFGYEGFDECVLHRMKGQPSNLLGTARSACKISNPPKPTLSTLASYEIPGAGFNYDAEGNQLVNFDVEGALKAGASKSNIAEYLCKKHQIDIAEARRRDYSDDEIIAKLASPLEGPRMAQTVRLPDGSIASFPDGVTPDQMAAAIAKDFPQFMRNAVSTTSCDDRAVNKIGQPLTGAARKVFINKCEKDRCEEQAVSKDGHPLAGAARNASIKKCEKASQGSKDDPSKKNVASTTSCEERAINKIGQPLTGAARNVFIKKCEKDRCEELAVSAAGRPLAGAARKVSIEKCEKAR
jgi:hypothetical protein